MRCLGVILRPDASPVRSVASGPDVTGPSATHPDVTGGNFVSPDHLKAAPMSDSQLLGERQTKVDPTGACAGLGFHSTVGILTNSATGRTPLPIASSNSAHANPPRTIVDNGSLITAPLGRIAHRLGNRELRLAMALVQLAGEQGAPHGLVHITASASTIAAKMDCSLTTFREAKRRLCQLGLLAEEAVPGSATRYLLDADSGVRTGFRTGETPVTPV